MIVLIHIERTGGSLIAETFWNIVPERTLRSLNAKLPDIGGALSSFPDRRIFVTGHFAYPLIEQTGLLQDGDPVVAVLRDPVDRMVSLYALARRNPEWFPGVAENIATKGLAQFFALYERHGLYTHNEQCRRICGVPDADAAIHAIERKYALVGTMAQFPKFGTALNGLARDWLPTFRLPIEFKGNAAPRTPDDAPDADLKAAILADSAEDARLVRYIEERHGGLFARQSVL